MRGHQQRALLIAILVLCAIPGGGCATVVGTAMSPITGGVDLSRQYLGDNEFGTRGDTWAVPFVWLGGVITGPFVALYNGVYQDISIVRGWGQYWTGFPRIFRPFEMTHEISNRK